MDPPRSDAALEDPPCGEQRGGAAGAALARRFLCATWVETTAAFGVACLVLIAFGVVTGVAYLICAAELAGAPRMLTSDFVAQHIGGAFRVPAYLIVIHCGGQIAYREAGATNVLVASKVAALCVVVLAALTAFGIATFVAQIASGQPALDLAGCAYALYINFGWHIFVLGAVSVAIQVTLRDAVRVRRSVDVPVDMLRSKWFSMLIAAAVFLAAGALGEGNTPFGPPPAEYSGMNGYGHDLERFCTSGLYWTAFAVFILVSTHAWTCRDERSRKRWLPQGVVNVGAPAVVIWAAMGCWIYYDTNMLDPHANETESAWRSEHEQRYKPRPERRSSCGGDGARGRHLSGRASPRKSGLGAVGQHRGRTDQRTHAPVPEGIASRQHRHPERVVGGTQRRVRLPSLRVRATAAVHRTRQVAF